MFQISDKFYARHDGTRSYFFGKEEFEKINDYKKTLDRCHNTVGVAILNTSITIVFGFSILVLSNFIPTIYFGFFTGVGLTLSKKSEGSSE